jgi:hypothetical protein
MERPCFPFAYALFHFPFLSFFFFLFNNLTFPADSRVGAIYLTGARPGS